MVASSERDADLYYATRFFAPDSLVLIQKGKKKILLTSDLEKDRAKKEAEVNEVFSTTALAKIYYEKYGRRPSLGDLIVEFARRQRIRGFLVPGSFPAKYLETLRKKGIRVRIKPDPFIESRAVKTPAEVRMIGETLRCVEGAAREAVEILRRSVIKKGRLYFQGQVLTSEALRMAIHTFLIRKHCAARRTIVACGKQGINPHEEGKGPLLAHQPIVLDIFPRNLTHGYYGDFTRTVVRGEASPKLKRMYAAVKEAQSIAFRMLRHGVNGRNVHESILKYFESCDFKTGLRNGRMQGFFHGTGHGLGLDIHERPRLGITNEILKAGHVVTVEPGLYYEDTGGVRLEDVVLITRTGCRNLTRFPKVLEV